MRHYELTCLIPSQLSSAELNSFQEKVISFLQEEKGILVKTDSLTKKGGDLRLLIFNFQLNPDQIEGFEKKLKAEKQIIRYLLITKELLKAAEISKKSPRFLKKIQKPKVELKEIEKKLEEILGE